MEKNIFVEPSESYKWNWWRWIYKSIDDCDINFDRISPSAHVHKIPFDVSCFGH